MIVHPKIKILIFCSLVLKKHWLSCVEHKFFLLSSAEKEYHMGLSWYEAELMMTGFSFLCELSLSPFRSAQYCSLVCFYRLVNENEVKQWKEQAEKMRKGTWPNIDLSDCLPSGGLECVYMCLHLHGNQRWHCWCCQILKCLCILISTFFFFSGLNRRT